MKTVKDEEKPAAPAEGDKPPEKKADEKAVSLFTSRLIAKPEPAEKKKEDEVGDKKKDDDKGAAGGDNKPEEKQGDEDGKKPAAKKPAQKPKAQSQQPLSREEISDIAEGVARGLKKGEGDKPEEKKEDEDAQLPHAEKRRISALAIMEKANPDKYKGIVQKYRTSIAKLVTYAEEWEKANPGKTFNEDEVDEDGKEIHAKFFKDNEVDWDDEDFTDALADLKAEEKVSKAMGKVDEKLELVNRSEKIRSIAPKIEKAKVDEARSYFSEVDAEYANLLKADGTVDPEVQKKLSEADPVKWGIVTAGADAVEAYTGEVTTLFEVDKSYNRENPIHVDINNFILRKEKQEMDLPREQQIDDKGRLFCPASEYHKLSESDKAKRWTFELDDVRGLLRAAFLKRTKAQIEAEEKKFAAQAKARGVTIPEKKAAAAAPEKKKEEPAKKKEDEGAEEDEGGGNGKPDSPSASPQPRINNGDDKGGEGKDAPNKFRERFIGIKT